MSRGVTGKLIAEEALCLSCWGNSAVQGLKRNLLTMLDTVLTISRAL